MARGRDQRIRTTLLAALALMAGAAATLLYPAPAIAGSCSGGFSNNAGAIGACATSPSNPGGTSGGGSNQNGGGGGGSGGGCPAVTPGNQACLFLPKIAYLPAVTPGQLAQQAYNTLALPKPDVQTAPPRGQDGMVGLPEWVWVPQAQWKPVSVTARAGAVWATTTATPSRISIDPGSGLGPVSCAGPGTAYDPSRPAAGQQPSCSVTYQSSSAGLPGSAYAVQVQIVWSITWVGSGGAGGVLPDLPTTTQFNLRIAEGQSVN